MTPRSSTCRSSSTTSLPRDLSDMSATLTKVKRGQAGPAGGLRPLQGRGHGGAADQASMKIDVPDDRHHPLRSGRRDRQVRRPSTTNDIPLPDPVGRDPVLRGPLSSARPPNYDALFKKTYPSTPTRTCLIRRPRPRPRSWSGRTPSSGPTRFDDQGKVRDAIAATDMQTFYGGHQVLARGRQQHRQADGAAPDPGRRAYNVVAPSKWASSEVNWPRQAPMN